MLDQCCSIPSNIKTSYYLWRLICGFQLIRIYLFICARIVIDKQIVFPFTRRVLWQIKCTKFIFSRGSAPDPAREAHHAPQTPSPPYSSPLDAIRRHKTPRETAAKDWREFAAATKCLQTVDFDVTNLTFSHGQAKVLTLNINLKGLLPFGRKRSSEVQYNCNTRKNIVF